MAIKVLQLHKRSSYEYKYIQDKYSFSEGSKCYAISDGTTQSFYSEIWSDLITKDFISKPTFEPKELVRNLFNCAKTFKEHRFTFSSNPAKASLERSKQQKGATATFIGAKINKDRSLSIISSGDSNIFVIRNNHLFSFPFKTISELDSNKFFLNTEKLLAGEIDETFFLNQSFPLEEGDVIILSTDALSRLILDVPNCISELLRISDFISLHEFCIRYWKKKLLEEDDITALIIQDFHLNLVNEITPPTDFNFPREETIEFIPTQQVKTLQNQQYENEMKEVLSSLFKVNEDLKQLKSKYLLLIVLMIFVILLIAGNTYLQLYYNPKVSSDTKEKSIQMFLHDLNNKNDSIKRQSEEIRKLKEELFVKDDSINMIKKEFANQIDLMNMQEKIPIQDTFIKAQSKPASKSPTPKENK